jgi:hypothetical protein
MSPAAAAAASAVAAAAIPWIIPIDSTIAENFIKHLCIFVPSEISSDAL